MCRLGASSLLTDDKIHLERELGRQQAAESDSHLDSEVVPVVENGG